MNKYSDYKIGENLRKIRLIRGETIEQVETAMHYCNDTIGQYERGEKLPRLNRIIDIAKHYRVPVRSITDGTYLEVSELNYNIADVKLAAKLISETFPIISKENSHDSNYLFAENRHRQLYLRYDDWYNKNDDTRDAVCDELYDIIDAYKDSYSENNSLDAAANICTLLLYGWNILGTVLRLATTNDLNCEKVNTASILFCAQDNPITEFKEEYAYGKDYTYDNLMPWLLILKQSGSTEYSYLADYYTALAFIYDATDNALSCRENMLIGAEMLSVAIDLKNPFALTFYEAYDGACSRNKKTKASQ